MDYRLKLRKARRLVMTTDKTHQIARLHKLIDFYKSKLPVRVDNYHPFYACE